jgi:RNA polymerase sigma-70 factor (ECF subfamily)
MVGSADDAEDLVQETFLRAWRGREGFQGRSLFRTWLYRIATNACLNQLQRSPRRVRPQDVAPPVTAATETSEARESPPWAPEIPWLQPYPDHLLEGSDPEAAAVSRETIELAYLAALQHLPPRQRAVLILRDVLDWSAKETAALLETTVASVNSALQRAKATMVATRGAAVPEDGATASQPDAAAREALRRFIEAWERDDAHALTALLREDARWSMPPAPLWFDGRGAIERLFRLYPIGFQGSFRMVPTGANRQPAAAIYLRAHGDETYRLTGVHVLRVQGDRIAEITTFSAPLCKAFALSQTL